jgi:hypothetical protein
VACHQVACRHRGHAWRADPTNLRVPQIAFEDVSIGLRFDRLRAVVSRFTRADDNDREAAFSLRVAALS